MAVALGDGGAVVEVVRSAACKQICDPGAEAHGAAEVDDLFLLLHEADDGVRGALVKLDAGGSGQAADVAGILDDGDLHAEADAEEGDAVFAGILGGCDLALGAAVSEATGNEDALKAAEIEFGTSFFDALCIDADDVHLAVVGGSGVGEGFVDALVGVLQLNVFANDADAGVVGGVDDALDEVPPAGEIWLRGREVEELAHHVIKPLFVEFQRHFIDAVLYIADFDDGLNGHVAEEGDLVADIGVQWHFCAAKDDVGADADLAEFGDALLRWFGLELPCGLDVGDEGGVDVKDVAMADFVPELADGLQEGQALNIAHGAADLGDDDVAAHFLCHCVDAGFDLVGDVGNDLHGAALILPGAFFFEDGGIDLAAGEVVELREVGVRKALVVSKIEVSLCPVVEHIHFAVFIRVHGAGVDIEIGVKLLHDDLEATMLQKGAEGRGGEAFSE